MYLFPLAVVEQLEKEKMIAKIIFQSTFEIPSCQEPLAVATDGCFYCSLRVALCRSVFRISPLDYINSILLMNFDPVFGVK